MANGPEHVRPGQVISSTLFNELTDWRDIVDDRLDQLDGGLGEQTVPNVFGRTLSQARTMLRSATVDLNLGRTIDAHGLAVEPNLLASQRRLVIGQAPAPGFAAPRGSPVDLLIAAIAETGTQPSPSPVIDTFSRPETPINEPVFIIGKNFNPVSSGNTVTFADVPTPVLQSTPNSLKVRVPPGIPNAPSSPGEKLKVTVRVVTDDGAGTGEHTILPPLAGEGPVIGNIDTSPYPTGVVNEDIKINGQNFSSDPSGNIVRFGSVQADLPIKAATDIQLTVTIPDLPQVPTPGSGAFVAVTVETGGRESDPEQLFVQRPTT